MHFLFTLLFIVVGAALVVLGVGGLRAEMREDRHWGKARNAGSMGTLVKLTLVLLVILGLCCIAMAYESAKGWIVM